VKRFNFSAVKRSGKKNLYIIPYIFTFLNAFFGFLSIIYTLDNDFVAATYCIIAAAVMDFWDGRLARAFNSVSGFGTELDSLCDAISFCLAPAILLYNWYLVSLDLLGIVVCGFYLCAGLSRLAKFNVSGHHNKEFFTGLPTPIAAFFISSFVLSSAWIDRSPFYFLLTDAGLVGTIVTLGLLMVSSIHFPAFKKYSLRSRSGYAVFCLIFLFIFVCLCCGYPCFFFLMLAYIIGAPVWQWAIAESNLI
jgi:CDP-diacylglycerol--serine O-phosphatidyltransferase